DRISDAAGQAVMPEASVAHHADRALVGLAGVECGSARPAETIAHRRRAQIEWREDRKKMAPDVAAHMMRAQFAPPQFHRGENRTLGTSGAERWRPRVDLPFDRSRP